MNPASPAPAATSADPIARARHAAEAAFRTWVPERCSAEWLDAMAGRARFRWDLAAMQLGWTTPLYRVFAARPERWRPVLAALLLEAGGVAPSDHGALLASLELAFLSRVMLSPIGNADSLEAAAPPELDIPLPIVNTVSFTAGHLAMTLVASFGEGLGAEARRWLLHEYTQAGYRTSLGFAIDHHRLDRRARQTRQADFLAHLKLCVTPFTFILPAAVASTALRQPQSTLARDLCEVAAATGIAYFLACEVLGHAGRLPRGPLGLRPEPPLDWSYRDALGTSNEPHTVTDARALALVDAHLQRAEDGRRRLPAAFAQAFATFIAATAQARRDEAAGVARA